MKTCELPDPRQLENRGMAWMIGAFVFCPCHLPITLAALALLLGGTAAGAALRAHPYLAAVDRDRCCGPRERGAATQLHVVASESLAARTGSRRSTGVGFPSRSSMTR